MRAKILTVDDSKTVRIIVRKAFKAYDCEILEAQNGVEGLAMAAKEVPDIILLDITMPVMDGVEMLTKIKADNDLKGIPVIMLTAEAGKEHVLKIAKIGVRDYIVKPFKEEVLVEKVSRVVELRPAGEAEAKKKSIEDPIDVLVVEDKPAIIKQLQDGLKHTPWKIHGVASTGEAIDFTGKLIPELVLISLSLPDDSALTLFRVLRSTNKTKYVPIFGLSVKTELEEQQRAQQCGFTSIITKPIDFTELELKASRSINLDTSGRYYRLGNDRLVIKMPANCTPAVLTEIDSYLKHKLSEAVDSGVGTVVFDVLALKSMTMETIKFIHSAMQVCKDLSLTHSMVGTGQVVDDCRGFEESKDWKFHESLDTVDCEVAKV
ncbi:MAG: response regulator [Puniceicoccaceae bacterium]|nr:MAG: response regulator [Puniceicoccaceae bacterium]